LKKNFYFPWVGLVLAWGFSRKPTAKAKAKKKIKAQGLSQPLRQKK
jgi:hypothetical protein